MKTFNSVFLKPLLLVLISAVCIVLSCTSLESKAKKAIKEELRLTMHDFKSYEPVQFGKLEVAMSSYEDEPAVGKYLDKAEVFLDTSQKLRETADSYEYGYSKDLYWRYTEQAKIALDSASAYMGKVDSIKLHFAPEAIGWKMKHTLRAKTLGGNFGLNQYEFYLDKECKKVSKTVDLSKEE
jgi:hypothetical protein